MTTFANEPLLELRREAVRREALDALAALDAKLPLDVPMLIGEDVVHGRRFASVDPSSPTRIVAHAHEATAAHVEDAVARAERGHVAWSRKPVAERAAALARAAGILRARRLELAALAVREAGKPWAEADADVCEAIDFLEYYAQGALALDGG
jgi:RHH-type proline utilization regulon transcriptional repressor/proline dehydrogenase/delta 1-pyrroline-5-carboxylate dehydrogenase